MKKFTILLITAFMAFAYNGKGQTTLYSQSFETDLSGYAHTPSQAPSVDPGDQYFFRAEPSDPAIYEGAVGPYTNVTDAWLFVGSNPNTINGGNPGLLTFDPITISGYSNLEFHADFGACPEDWDAGDDLRVEYNFDGGSWLTLYYFEAYGDGTNEPLELTGNAAGGVNTANGTVLTYDLTTISSNNFLGSGSILNIRIVCNANANYEAFGLDNIVVIGTAGGNNPPNISNIVQSPSFDITSSTSVSVTADVTDIDGTIANVELHWGTTSGVLTNTISMSVVSLDTYATDSDIPGQPDGTIVYYEVYAEDDIGDGTTSPEANYAVFDPQFASLPYLQEFNPDFGDMYTRSQIGDQFWSITNFGNPAPCAIMSGYSGVALDNEDWLITPSFDFTISADVIAFSFEEAINFESSVVDNEKVFISTDYTGIGDPTLATWTELTMPARSPGNSWSFFPTGELDITSYAGNSNVHLAFKYLSTTAGAGTWEVDNVSVNAYSLINWANLQWPGVGAITVGTTYTVYAQAYEPGVTDAAGQGAGITTWIGYSTTDTDPSTWTDWVEASYLGDVGNNDEYSLDLGLEILSAGTYYYASRFQLGTAPYQYGGFQGGFWDGVNNVSGVLTVNPPSAQIDWANVQWPPDGIINLGGDFTVYAQVYEPGVTDPLGQGADITAWIGYSTTDTDPATWTDWVPATFNVDAGLNDEYMANIGAAITSPGTVYYASRFKLGLADYVYGGFNGGFWDGITNVSGMLSINGPDIVINEADADTPGTDAAEFIELYSDGGGNVDLSGLVVVLFNGNGDVSYNSYDLDGFSTDVNGYFLLGNAGVVPTPSIIFPSNTLQNGADAIALYLGNASDFPNGTPVTTVNLLDALVYDSNDGDDSGLLVLLNPGQPQINEDNRGDISNNSSQRIPNGSGGPRNTDTYDQSDPTPGAVNISVFTDWTGAINDSWEEQGNWANGVPSLSLNASIADVGPNPYPVISTTGAICNRLNIAANAELYINVNGDLTTNGTFANSGTFTIMTDGTANVGSLIDNGGISGGGTFHFYREMMGTSAAGADHGWHFISPPTDGLTSDQLLPDYYLNWWDEANDTWVHVEGGDCSNPAVYPFANGVGYSVLRDLEYTCPNPVGNTMDFGGPFYNMHNSGGTYSAAYTNSGSFEGGGWNLFGNPFTSPIDNNTMLIDAAFPATLNAAVYIYDDNSLDYMEFSGGVGVAQVPATQGFFMQATGTGSLTFDNAWRTHAGSDNFYKEAIADVLELSVAGNGYSDNIFIRFHDEATAGFDGMYDAHKLLSSAEFVPQIYTTNGVNKLAINALPATAIVPMGFTSVTSGEYTISAVETSEFTNVVLEDRFWGVQTNLLTDSYTFNYNINDDADRFFIHFTPLGIGDNLANGINIWSEDHNIHVQSTDISGDIVVFNMMGQEITRAKIETGLNVIPVTDVNAFYIVKIVGSELVKTGKVYVK